MTTNNGGNGGEWQTVGSKNRGNEGGYKWERETGGSPMQVAAEMRDNGKNRGRSNATGINNTNEDDGMQSYNAKTGDI
jgi:hypothetical protein